MLWGAELREYPCLSRWQDSALGQPGDSFLFSYTLVFLLLYLCTDWIVLCMLRFSVVASLGLFQWLFCQFWRSPYSCCCVHDSPCSNLCNDFELVGRPISFPVWDACHPLWASQFVRALWPYVIVCGEVNRSHLWSSALMWAIYYWFYDGTLFCFYNTMF